MLEKDPLKLAESLEGMTLEEVTATLGIGQLMLLDAILSELKAIRLATEQANEPGPEDEPSPFQSLKG